MKEEIQRSYYPNGKIWSEIPYLNRKIHGLSKRWHSNGQIQSETLYLNGNQHGLRKSWYSNRQLWYEIPYNKYIQCGAKIYFDY